MNDPQQGGYNSTTEPLIVALTYAMDRETLTQWRSQWRDCSDLVS